jgi:hypothetical protein
MERSYHIWYYGNPHADSTPFTSIKAARVELARQLDVAARNGEYPAAQIVSIRNGYCNDVRVVDGWDSSRQ